MSPDFFEHVLEQIVPYTGYVYLHVQGEPLLHPDFRTILSICFEHHVKTALVTNGSLLANYPDLLSYLCLHRISVSLQSLPFHAEGSMEAMTESLLSLIKNAKGSPYIELRLWRRESMEHPRIRYVLDHLANICPEPIVRNDHSIRLSSGVFLNYDREFEWPGSGEYGDSHGTCLGAVRQIAVLADGTVVPCCLDAEGRIPLGSLKESSLEEILNGKRYLAMAEGFRRHNIIEPLCRKCTFRKRFDCQ